MENELTKRTLLQDINRHAAVVLEGRTLGNDKFGGSTMRY